MSEVLEHTPKDNCQDLARSTKAAQTLEAIDTLAVSLAGHEHHWSTRERWLYGRARSWLTTFVCDVDSAA